MTGKVITRLVHRLKQEGMSSDKILDVIEYIEAAGSEEENETQGSELIAASIKKYADLRRIINTDDPKKEAEYQLKPVKASLEAMGIVTADLDIKNNG